MKPSLSLGTAQFGLSYGITNTKGKISSHEAKSIFQFASSNGVEYIDTAQSYGNAEDVISKNLPVNSTFKIITKLSPQTSKIFTVEDKKYWETSFIDSKRKIGNKPLYGFLIHSINDLKKTGSQFLYDWLKKEDICLFQFQLAFCSLEV